MSVKTTSQAQAAGGFITDFIGSIKFEQYLMIIPFILSLIYFIFIDRNIIKKINIKEDNYYNDFKAKSKKAKQKLIEKKKLEQVEIDSKFNKKVKIIGLITTIVLLPIYYSTIYIPFMQNDLQMVQNKVLYRNPSMPNIVVNQFGILGYEFIDIKSLFISIDDETLEFSSYEQEITDYSRIIDDTDWISKNDSESNKDYRTLNSYFMSKNITSKNEYTGLFKDKNLIVIMMESGSNIITDYPEYFPNLNKLYNEGWAWENAFSPRNSCSTGNNEMTGLTSLYTINDTCTINQYQDNTYYEAMFNLFNYAGYNTSSYHDYTDHFYARSVYHPNMGSNNYYDVNKLNIKLGSEYQPWPKDTEFFEKAIPNFINQDKFFAWITTVSTHMTYINSSVTGNLYLDKFSDKSWNIANKRYMSKLTILDNAVGELLDELESSGKLDDTVIVLYADHYPYGLGEDTFSQIAKYDVTNYGNIDRTPFIIYNPQLEPTKYQEYTTFVNILPTLANLFDLDYDPRVYGGTDLLSEDYNNIAVWADGSWRSDIAYYDASKGSITYFGDETYTSEEILKINTKITNEIKMDNLAIKTNYFKYLGNILNKEVLTEPYYEDEENIEENIEENKED
jgi:phosphoglycerol transferase MdoB-like AlkP superfamily enzyme